MKVLVFGASGATGRSIVTQAVQRGHEVVAFIRGQCSEGGVAAQHFVYGDATRSNDVNAALAGGFDAVISALGARSLKRTRLLETAVTSMIEAMRRTRTARLIELSAAGTFGLPRQSRISFPKRVTFEILRRTILRHSFEDHAAADRLIHESELDWTILQPPELSDEPPRGYRIATDGLSCGGAIARANVAAAIVDVMEAGSFVRQSPFVSRAPGTRPCGIEPRSSVP